MPTTGAPALSPLLFSLNLQSLEILASSFGWLLNMTSSKPLTSLGCVPTLSKPHPEPVEG
jgi:hypothetical protein